MPLQVDLLTLKVVSESHCDVGYRQADVRRASSLLMPPA